MTDLQAWYAVAVISLVTVSLRFLPFVIFNGNRKTPKTIDKLGKILPYAVIAGLVVAALHAWKRNTLLSIICGTVCYMMLVQFVF